MLRHVAVALTALGVLAPVGFVAADDTIERPAAALQAAERTGNRVGPAPVADPAPPPVPNVSVEMQRVLDLVNIERTSRGLVPLRFSAQLNAAALGHTQDQAAVGDTYHTDPRNPSNTPRARIIASGYRFSTWGENVAAGYRSPESVMRGWMTSEGHCRNILNPAFTEIGVGHVTGGRVYGQFWTQKLGRPSGEPRPAGTYNPAWC